GGEALGPAFAARAAAARESSGTDGGTPGRAQSPRRRAHGPQVRSAPGTWSHSRTQSPFRHRRRARTASRRRAEFASTAADYQVTAATIAGRLLLQRARPSVRDGLALVRFSRLVFLTSAA